MPLDDHLSGRAETRTPEPPDRDEHQESPPRIRPKRVTRAPSSYAREQEEQNETNKARIHWVKRLRGRSTSQSDAPAVREAPTPDGTPTDSEEPDLSMLLVELTKLRKEIRRRDEAR
jgi:hypothetical protein